MRGKEPYFLKENKEWVDRVINGEEEETHSLAEIHNEKEAVRNLKRQKHDEFLYVLNNKGTVISEIKGKGLEVDFDDELLTNFKDCRMIHNHPDGFNYEETNFNRVGHSLSGGDMEKVTKANAREITAYSPLYKYSVIRKGKDWSLKGEDMYKRYDEIYRSVYKEYSRSLEHHPDFAVIIQHITMKRLAKACGFIYKKEKL